MKLPHFVKCKIFCENLDGLHKHGKLSNAMLQGRLLKSRIMLGSCFQHLKCKTWYWQLET